MKVSLLCALLAALSGPSLADGDAATSGARRVILPQASAASPRSPADGAAALAAARKSLARGQLDSVLVHLQQPGGAPALEAQVLIAAAEKAHQRKDEPLALQLAQLAQQRDPTQPLAARRLGEWSLAAREFGQAQRYAKLWLEAAPSDLAAQHFSLRVQLLSESWHPALEKPQRRARGKHQSLAAANAREYPRDWDTDAPSPAARAAASGDAAPEAAPAAARDGDLEAKPAATRHAAAGPGSVILYGTSWCPYCRKAREHLRQRGVAFTDRDIEKDPAAEREMTDKERAQGLAHRGVPVLDIHGTLLEGFSAQAIDEALKQ